MVNVVIVIYDDVNAVDQLTEREVRLAIGDPGMPAVPGVAWRTNSDVK